MKQQQIKTVSIKDQDYVDLEFDPEFQAVWARLHYAGRPCITLPLIRDLQKAQQRVARVAQKGFQEQDPDRLRYQILCSRQPGIFCLGGDLELFIQLIRSGDRSALAEYAKCCIDVLYDSATSYRLPFTTIALVQGETLGGGFEAALSATVVIAERGSRFGFPETVFGMFPGMGAFSFLARRIAPALAKRIIASGKVYTADELYQMGVVDQVVDDGQGVSAVHEFIRHQRVRSGGFEALDKVVDQFNPISYQELMDVVEIWVDTAMQLSEKNIRLMTYLISAQNRRWSGAAAPEVRNEEIKSA